MVEEKLEDLEKEGKPEVPKKKKDKILSLITFVNRILIIAIILWLATNSYYGLVFFIMSMLPYFVVRSVDSSANKSISMTILSFNFIGVFPYLFNFAINYDIDMVAKSYLLDLKVWIYIYSCSFMGGVLLWLLPNIVAFLLILRSESKIRNVIINQNKLQEEWGEEINSSTEKEIEKLVNEIQSDRENFLKQKKDLESASSNA